MALLWADGFDHYGNTANMTKGSYTRADVNMTSDPAKVRTGGFALDITGGDNSDKALLRPVTIAGPTIGVGFALLTTSNPPSDGRFQYRVNNAGNNPIIAAVFNGNSGIDILCGGVILASTPALVLVPGAYSYVELAFTLDPVQGRVVCRVNNAVVIDVSNLNTIGDGGLGIPYSSGFVKPGGASSSWPTWYMDDYVIWDASGNANNQFFGDIRCRTIFPEANGLNQNWLPHGAAQGWDCVNDVPPDPVNTYISGANVGDLSTFDLQAVPSNTGAIYGVMMHVNLNKADAGACGVVAGLGSQGQTTLSGTINPGTGAAYYSRAFQTDPNTGNGWTKDSINAAQAIIERVQ